MKKVVVIGGGTGSSVVLKGLKKYENCNLYAIVPMGDSGGSTGKLREQYGFLSAGEIRQRLIALATEENEIKEFVNVLDHRFETGELKGHSFGNILLAAFMEHHGSQKKAIELASKLVNVKGKIIPSTWERFELVAECKSGRRIVGEHFIDESEEEGGIVRLYTEPLVKTNPQAVEAIKNADVIIIGPGDLYSSILHNIVVDGIAQAIRESKAKKIFISNLMTSLGETTGMTLQDMLNELEKYIGASLIEILLVNSKQLPMKIVKEYNHRGEFPVNNFLNEETLRRVKMIEADLLAEKIYIKSKADVLHRSILRHDPNKLANTIFRMINP